MNNKKSYKLDVFSIIVSVFIVLFLIVFYALGIYFLMGTAITSVGAGCIGIGVGMIGTGVFLFIILDFLAISNVESSCIVVDGPVGVDVEIRPVVMPINPVFKVVASVTDNNMGNVYDNVDIMIDADVLYIGKMFDEPIKINLSSISNLDKFDSILSIVCKYDDGISVKDGRFSINVPSVLKMKAIEQLLVKNMKDEV